MCTALCSTLVKSLPCKLLVLLFGQLEINELIRHLLLVEIVHVLVQHDCVGKLFHLAIVFQIDSPVLPPIDPQLQAELMSNMEQVTKHVYDLHGQNSFIDPRPMNVTTYAILSRAPSSVCKLLILEALADCTDKEALRLLAKKEYVRLLSEPGMQDKLNVSVVR